MVGSLLLRGMLVGVLAGLVAFGFARLYGEPQVALAIAFEEASGGHSHAEPAPAAAHSHDGHAHAGEAHDHGPAAADEEVFSRATQAGPGLLVALTVYGAAMGGLLALVFAFANGRLGALSPRAVASLLALAAFVALVLVPGLKYPPNPPAVGDAATIGLRTRLFFLMLSASLIALVGAVALARRLAARNGAWNGSLIAALAYVAVIAGVMALLPAIDEVPDGFSASLLWQFRLSALGLQAVLWGVMGIAFGAWVEYAPLSSRPRLAPAH
ncbi:hypothetical conserved protein [Azorhizobium caulinodans ORS 571]|uniref:Hypothetical conserved protein n=1 Tax=Azorhizobium caulinodans (strain ATCC 43989 / DSM 5975 / JCM 20966 / LMG 6465 / NBRC 14845 / NCIMB 13405 / ORS 571) TaxID=438753 RepID=A8HXT1_AZOC5|nr:CbtA family protein [Azorhizobium caulinodans]BAF87534.1 hypothetical conserved protein [Azorhizobium caulinodans ORS 571]